MSANEHIDELLSGFLDGKLTAEEMRELDLAMSEDASLKVKLEDLRQLGSDLRSFPKRTLGPDFANRVLVAAQREAAAMERAGSLDKPLVQAVPTIPNEVRRGSWRPALASLAALAATLLFAAFISNWFTSPSGDLAQKDSPVEAGSAETSSDNLNPEKAPESETKVQNPNGNFVRNDPQMRQRSTEFAMLTIMEIEPSQKAWKENEVSKVLGDAGIAWTNPLKVSDEVIEVLNDTRSINRGPSKADGEQIALVMVMANGRSLDKALKKILDNVEAFPHVVFDVAFDLPGKELRSKLVDAQVSIANGQRGIASPIVARTLGTGMVTPMESFAQFSSLPRPRESYLDASQRRASDLGIGSVGISAEDEDEVSHVLFLIRQPAK